MKMLASILLVIASVFTISSQSNTEDYELVRKFYDAFSLIVSEDNSTMALIVDNNKIEVYDIKSLSMLRRIKATRNTWLLKGFFEDNNRFLYFDYGMQRKIKYRKLDIKTGEVSKADCSTFSRGCSYEAIKICDPDSTTLLIQNGKYMFKSEGIYINMYKRK